MAIKYDNCKDCHSRCVHAGKDREFICINGVSCKITKEKPNTNADRIRAMSDEELAELIVKHHPMHAWNKQVREIYFGFDDHRKDNPQKAWLEWLKQPAVGGSL